jgi:hypothetical protein
MRPLENEAQGEGRNAPRRQGQRIGTRLRTDRNRINIHGDPDRGAHHKISQGDQVKIAGTSHAVHIKDHPGALDTILRRRVSTVLMIDYTVAIDVAEPSDITLEQTSLTCVPMPRPDRKPMGIEGAAVIQTGNTNPGVVRWTRARRNRNSTDGGSVVGIGSYRTRNGVSLRARGTHRLQKLRGTGMNTQEPHECPKASNDDWFRIPSRPGVCFPCLAIPPPAIHMLVPSRHSPVLPTHSSVTSVRHWTPHPWCPHLPDPLRNNTR